MKTPTTSARMSCCLNSKQLQTEPYLNRKPTVTLWFEVGSVRSPAVFNAFGERRIRHCSMPPGLHSFPMFFFSPLQPGVEVPGLRFLPLFPYSFLVSFLSKFFLLSSSFFPSNMATKHSPLPKTPSETYFLGHSDPLITFSEFDFTFLNLILPFLNLILSFLNLILPFLNLILLFWIWFYLFWILFYLFWIWFYLFWIWFYLSEIDFTFLKLILPFWNWFFSMSRGLQNFAIGEGVEALDLRSSKRRDCCDENLMPRWRCADEQSDFSNFLSVSYTHLTLPTILLV